MQQVNKWCCANEICLNMNKTIEMVFKLKRLSETTENVNHVKFLGTILDPSLKFNIIRI